MNGYLTKRSFLKYTIAGASTIALPGALFSPSAEAGAALCVYDSRVPTSSAYAQDARSAGLQTFDLAPEEDLLWRNLRAGFGLRSKTRLIGMTRWSEWTVLRGALEPLGWRVHREVIVEPSHRVTLFAWTMA